MKTFEIPVDEELRDYCWDFRNSSRRSTVSNKGGWQSAKDIHTDPYIDKRFVRPLHKALEELEIDVKGCWINSLSKGAWNVRHNHVSPECDLVVIWYVQIDPTDTGGKLIVYTPDTTHTITPKEGLAILFPPEWEHEVTPTTLPYERLSISANLSVKPNDHSN